MGAATLSLSLSLSYCSKPCDVANNAKAAPTLLSLCLLPPDRGGLITAANFAIRKVGGAGRLGGSEFCGCRSCLSPLKKRVGCNFPTRAGGRFFLTCRPLTGAAVQSFCRTVLLFCFAFNQESAEIWHSGSFVAHSFDERSLQRRAHVIWMTNWPPNFAGELRSGRREFRWRRNSACDFSFPDRGGCFLEEGLKRMCETGPQRSDFGGAIVADYE